MKNPSPIQVVDIFAGPGGLSEGFSEFRQNGFAPFRTVLSIEKDSIACQTLQLRKFIRSFPTPPDEYIAFSKGEIGVDELYRHYPAQAKAATAQTWNAELGKIGERIVSKRVSDAIGSESAPWILVGGPPCQAYSLAGRSRMRSTNPDFEKDERHFLYREYLQIVARHRPSVFVMENVRGILTSTNGGSGIFDRIIRDLRHPAEALNLSQHRNLEYRLYGLAPGANGEFKDGCNAADHFLLKAEDFGIPQTRHRIFIVGVRSDIAGFPAPLEPSSTRPGVEDVLSDLPALRSKVSRSPDSWNNWRDSLISIKDSEWMRGRRQSEFGAVAAEATKALKLISDRQTTGSQYTDLNRSPRLRHMHEWYRRNATGITLHEARGHMVGDLHRYLFASSYAKVNGQSPHIRDFPADLWPDHRNIMQAVDGGMFSDRFRVQCAEKPSTTITSHIAKDGHYFIHYAPEQCRSLTVREAARLQTFPDDYYFCGNRTQQYHQVGNAVPPLLAVKVADRIFELLRGR